MATTDPVDATAVAVAEDWEWEDGAHGQVDNISTPGRESPKEEKEIVQDTSIQELLLRVQAVKDAARAEADAQGGTISDTQHSCLEGLMAQDDHVAASPQAEAAVAANAPQVTFYALTPVAAVAAAAALPAGNMPFAVLNDDFFIAMIFTGSWRQHSAALKYSRKVPMQKSYRKDA